MDVRRLRAHLKAKGWSQAELARRVGVSRQAVSQWLSGSGSAGMRASHLMKVSEALAVPIQDLTRPLPCFDESHDRLMATLLWDWIYPDLDDLAIAVGRWEPRAVARLVEVYGLYASARIIGQGVWRRFPSFSQFIHPVRRRQLEALAEWKRNRTIN